MRSIASVTLVLLAGAVAFAGNQSRRSKEPELTPQTFEAGRFKAAFPGKVGKPDTRRVKTDAGELVVTTISVAVSRELTLAVTWTDYPDSFQALPADKMLDAVVGGMKTKNAELKSDKPVSAADPNPAGREVVYDYGKYRVRARLYWVGTRLYQVTATGENDDVAGTLANKFLAAFQLTE